MELWHAQVLWLDYANSFTSDKFQINLQLITFAQFMCCFTHYQQWNHFEGVSCSWKFRNKKHNCVDVSSFGTHAHTQSATTDSINTSKIRCNTACLPYFIIDTPLLTLDILYFNGYSSTGVIFHQLHCFSLPFLRHSNRLCCKDMLWANMRTMARVIFASLYPVLSMPLSKMPPECLHEVRIKSKHLSPTKNT